MTGGRTAVDVARLPAGRQQTRWTIAHGATAIALRSDDPAAAGWLAEFLAPWFAPTAREPDWHVTLSTAADRYRTLAARRPRDAAPRASFALDQQVVSLPAWPEDAGVAVADVERSCFLVVEPGHVALVGDAATRRWRFTLQWIFHEIAATRLRRSALDLHAAAVESGGRALLIVGPKGAGKTTLSFHLLRSGRCRWIANDRAFAQGTGAGFDVRGMPTPVKILASTLERFPELGRGLRPSERPYLDALDEVVGEGGGGHVAPPPDLALSPVQVAHQLGVEARACAPLGAIVFPEIRADVEGCAVERLGAAAVAARLWSNLYGKPSARCEATPFEDFEGGRHAPRRELASELAGSAPGYRVVLGRSADAHPEHVLRLLEMVRE